MIDHDRSRLLAALDVDRSLVPAERRELESHLAACEACRAYSARLREDQRGLLASLDEVPVAPRVRTTLIAASRRDRRPSIAPLLAAALLIVALAVAALVAGGGRQAFPAAPTPSPSASASTPPSPSPEADAVTGSFTYSVVEGSAGRRVTVDARGTDLVTGRWTFAALPDGDTQGGPVTCLVVDGRDAYLFGPPGSAGGRAFFLWVRDEGEGGADDRAIGWMQDLATDPLPSGIEPQTLAELEGWCRNRGAGFIGPGQRQHDPGLRPLTSGDVTVHDAP
jgi:hypothetical protein